MKSIDLFCASQASTAICSSMDQRAIVRHGTRPIDRPRQVHRLGESPKNRTNAAPCSFPLPIDPSCKPFYQKSRKSTSASTKQTENSLRRKSSADVNDLAENQSSTRYLLSDKPYLDFILDNERAMICARSIRDEKNVKRNAWDSYPVFRSLSNNEKSSCLRLSDHLKNVEKSPSVLSKRQVVELRVSIHCKGCEGKLRKHISRMEGVTSFSIDLTTKKVTIIGDITPQGVLASISKVKNAQFWPSPTSSSSSSSSSVSASSPRVSLAAR